MHEATIAVQILKAIESKVSPSDDVSMISVRIGAFRNVDPESLIFAFNALRSEYGPFADCLLVIETGRARALCTANKHEYAPRPEDRFTCPQCGSGIGQLLSGEELDVTGYSLQLPNKRQDNARTS